MKVLDTVPGICRLFINMSSLLLCNELCLPEFLRGRSKCQCDCLWRQDLYGGMLTQLCPTLCDPRDCSPPGSSVHGIFQARILGGVCHILLQGIFQTQGWNSHLLHLLHWQAGSLPLTPPGKPHILFIHSSIVGICIVSTFWLLWKLFSIRKVKSNFSKTQLFLVEVFQYLAYF